MLLSAKEGIENVIISANGVECVVVVSSFLVPAHESKKRRELLRSEIATQAETKLNIWEERGSVEDGESVPGYSTTPSSGETCRRESVRREKKLRLEATIQANYTGKTRRLRQAKEEAQGEIEQYRGEREREFAQKQHTVLGSQGGLSSEVEQQTQQKIQSMTKSYRSNRERELRHLLTITCQINPQIHCNYRA
ncbi:hypothetical protein SKAU_G00396420 [Synaphobranchus kaupii]|uniref:V-type proton ATPase subunit G n=1 Tax=Synaphobranchus kaupii TaxID=118154 RepID=A0A9Q1IE51_SYNKA|nr:hypothetical protein SKAU_G00396420 [Synaphobranchus kaupii]